MYRLGMIGAGYLPRTSLASALSTMADFTMVAAFDADERALARLREAYPGVAVTTSEAEFFAHELDAVHIALPNSLHADFACRAIERGLAVLVDKPLAATVADGARISRASRSASAPVMVGYMSKFNAVNRAVVEIVESGRFGRLLSMTARHLGARTDDWRLRRRDSGFGSLGDLGIYPVSMSIDLFGADPVSCRATAYPAGDPVRTDLWTEATIEFPGGRRLQFHSSFTLPTGGFAEYTLVLERALVHAAGSWAMDGGGELAVWTQDGRQQIPMERRDPYVLQYELLRRCDETGIPVPRAMSVARGLADLEILDAIDRSAALHGASVDHPVTTRSDP